MQGTGYPCDEEAESQIRKPEVTKKPATAGSHYQAGGTKGGGSTSPDGRWNQNGLKTWRTSWILR